MGCAQSGPAAAPASAPAGTSWRQRARALSTTRADAERTFKLIDSDGNGSIDFGELKRGLRRLGVAPRSLSKLIEAGEAPRPSV